MLKAEAQNIGDSGARASSTLERELKSAIAAAASLEREKNVVEEELRGAKSSLERLRVTEKDLRTALKREQDMVVQVHTQSQSLEFWTRTWSLIACAYLVTSWRAFIISLPYH